MPFLLVTRYKNADSDFNFTFLFLLPEPGNYKGNAAAAVI